MVRLHSLQSMAKHSTSLEIKLSLFGDNHTLYAASGPERVAHGSPGILRVGAVVCGAVLSAHEAWRCPCELHIHHAILI